jgi:hypothetical protein
MKNATLFIEKHAVLAAAKQNGINACFWLLS